MCIRDSGEPFPAAGLPLGDTLGDFPNLLMQQPLLAFLADGDFLKLRVSDNDGIIVAGGDAGAELLAVEMCIRDRSCFPLNTPKKRLLYLLLIME